jgi:hypothetical protein
MSQVYSIAVVVGSLRADSINRKIALALAALAPGNLQLKTLTRQPRHYRRIRHFARRLAQRMECCS